jgi:hypothetical protein
MKNYVEVMESTSEQSCSNPLGWLALILLLLVFVTPLPLSAQGAYAQVQLCPSNPMSSDNIIVRLSGVWSNGCVPQSPIVSISSTVIRIKTSNPWVACTQAIVPWSLTPSVGPLAPGAYSIIVDYTGPGLPTPVEIARKSFSVSPVSLYNEVILPVVVNGSIADKLHYQTIFTILNTTAQTVVADLQVYSNEGAPGGVFCSPVAPPPSIVSATLKPGADYVSFTSADLPFHDGWARLRWQGSTSLVAGAEVTLVGAPPSPCLLVCNRPSTEKISSTQVPAVVAAREFRFPVTINRFRQTALALINPSATESASVRVTVLNASGETAALGVPGTFDVRIQPLERVSRFLWQLALDHSSPAVVIPVPDSFQGSVVLTGDKPFAVGALNVMFPEGKLVSIPAVSDP